MIKQVLITGAARRMGRAVSLGLARHGWDVAVHYYQSEAAALELQHEIRELGRRCEIFRADLAGESNASLLLDRVLKVFPDLFLVINSASVYRNDTARTAARDDLQRNLNIHLIAPFCLIKRFTEHQRSGSVINIIDTRIKDNDTSRFSYSISKSALAVLTRMTALEYAPDFRINGISPGAVLPPGDHPEMPLDPVKCNPLKKIVSLQSIINTILFLLDNDDITGQIISVDGGQNLL